MGHPDASGYYWPEDAPTLDPDRGGAQGGVGRQARQPPALLEKLATLIGGGPSGDHEELSNRELEVFKLIAQGESLVRIGETLHLSPNTVTTSRSRILEKMGMSSNAELTRYALEHGLI